MPITQAPAFYLDNLARKRQRSDDLRQGLSQGFGGAVEGLDAMGKLMAALEEKKASAATAASEAERQRAEDERKSTEWNWKVEDRKRADADRVSMQVDADADRQDLMRRALEQNASDVADMDLDDGARGIRMADAIQGVRDDLAVDESSEIDRRAQLTSALGDVQESVDTGSTMMTGDEQLALARANLANAQAEKVRRPAPMGGPRPAKVDPNADLKRQTLEERLRSLRLRNEKAQSEAGRAGARPNVKEATDVTELSVALDEAERLASTAGTIDTGPIANLRNFLAQKVGVDDPEVTAYKASIGEQLAQYIKSISGATVAANERAALLQNVPTFADDDTAFMAKLQRVIMMLEAKKAAMIKAQSIAGKDVSGYVDTPAPSGSSVQRATGALDPASIQW